MIRIILLALLISSLEVRAQNLLVVFYGDNQPYVGLTNWPMVAQPVSFTTNVAGWNTNLSLSQFDAWVTQRQPVYDAGASNLIFTLQSNSVSNYNAWASMYLQIPQGISDSSNRLSYFTNLIAVTQRINASWKSGTNSAAQTNTLIASVMTNMVNVAQQDQYTWTYLNQIIVYLSRLGPGLQQVYQPANDPVGH